MLNGLFGAEAASVGDHWYPSDPELIQYVVDRLRKPRPSKKDAVLNSIGAMFQFQGGVSDSDKKKIFSELLSKRHITIAEHNRVSYPDMT